MLSALFIVAAVFAGVYVLATRYPKVTERWFRRIWTARILIFGAFWLAFGLAAIASGVAPLMLLGVGIYALAAAYVIFENPQQTVKAWIR